MSSAVCAFAAAPGNGEMTPEQSEAMRQCMRGVKEATQAASNDHKDMHATISKLGKAIDKVQVFLCLLIPYERGSCCLQNFSADISGMSVDDAFSGQPCQELNKVICEHLFRQGKMDVGESLMKVCVLCVLSVGHTP